MYTPQTNPSPGLGYLTWMRGLVAASCVLFFGVSPADAKEVILQTRENVDAGQVARVLELPVLRPSLAEIQATSRVLVEFPDSLDIDQVRQWLVIEGSPVIGLEENQVLHADGRPQSFIDKLPSVGEFWTQEAGQIISGDRYEGLTGGKSEILAVIDTGIDPSHPLFTHVEIFPGWDFVDNDETPFDEVDGIDNDDDGYVDESFGHGTSVASLVLLVERQARIAPYRILDADGQGHLFDLIAAVEMAVGQGARVLQISASMSDPSELLETALVQARDQGTLVVASSGNTGRRESRYPAAYENVMGVAASDANDVLDPASTRGGSVDLVAPGVSSIVARPGGVFDFASGSSMAAPLVAGSALRLMARCSDVEIIESALLAGAHDISDHNPGDEDSLGDGRLDIAAATKQL